MKKLGLIAVPLLAVAFLTNCNKNNWWDHTEQLTEADIGKIETININNQNHRVRLIDIDHDMLANGTGFAHTTWEFVDLISDSDGYSLATPWEWEQGDEAKNWDFLNSNLRAALDGMGHGKICWYQIGQKNQSTTYTSSVYNMLPRELQRVLKNVIKPIALYGDEFELDYTRYVTNLFTLSCNEISVVDKEEYVLREGTPYKYYLDNKAVDRIKAQVKGKDGALSDSIILSAHGHKANNYAGYNSIDGEEYGSFYWLRSPCIHDHTKAQKTKFNGDVYFEYGAQICDNLYPIAPAFCI